MLDSYDNDERYSVGTPERIAELQSYADETFNKKEAITRQLSDLD